MNEPTNICWLCGKENPDGAPMELLEWEGAAGFKTKRPICAACIERFGKKKVEAEYVGP